MLLIIDLVISYLYFNYLLYLLFFYYHFSYFSMFTIFLFIHINITLISFTVLNPCL